MLPVILPRHVQVKELKRGGYGFYYVVPTEYRKVGCTVPNQALGGDYGIVGGAAYILTSNKPSFGGFIANVAEGAVIGAVAGTGVGLVSTSIVGAGAHVVGNFVTAAAENNLARYGNNYAQTAGIVGLDAIAGFGGTYVGGTLAGPITGALRRGISAAEESAIANANVSATVINVLSNANNTAPYLGEAVGDIAAGAIQRSAEQFYDYSASEAPYNFQLGASSTSFTGSASSTSFAGK